MDDQAQEMLLEEECRSLERQLAARTAQYRDTLEKVQLLERVVGRATTLANQVSYLCSTLPEGSLDIEQAASQLHDILTRRV